MLRQILSLTSLAQSKISSDVGKENEAHSELAIYKKTDSFNCSLQLRV